MKFGNVGLNNIMLGDKQILKRMYGDKLIWENIKWIMDMVITDVQTADTYDFEHIFPDETNRSSTFSGIASIAAHQPFQAKYEFESISEATAAADTLVTLSPIKNGDKLVIILDNGDIHEVIAANVGGGEYDPDGTTNPSTTSLTSNMTSDTTPIPFKTFGTGSYAESTPWKAFDGEATTYFYDYNQSQWLAYQFDTPKVINKLYYKTAWALSQGVTLFGSNDSTNGEDGTWDNLGYVGSPSVNYATLHYQNDQPYLMYRMEGLKGSTGEQKIYTVELYEAEQSPYTMNTAAITNGEIPSKVFTVDAKASFAISAGFIEAEAIDNNYSTRGVSEVIFDAVGIHQWTPPVGVTRVSVVAVGGGGGGAWWASGGNGGGGGGLGYKNDIQVVEGVDITIQVGAGGSVGKNGSGGTSSFFDSESVVAGLGGQGGVYSYNAARVGGSFVGDGGGQGGGSPAQTTEGSFGGGGAGGYSGKGGNGGNVRGSGTAGAGGAGGGGGGGESGSSSTWTGGGGGGVGLFGEGLSGGTASKNGGGRAGSDGAHGTGNSTGRGGLYGGAGAGADSSLATVSTSCKGSSGAVRIIWGDNRHFPSTNVEAIPESNLLLINRFKNLVDSTGSTTITPKVLLKSIGDKMIELRGSIIA